MAPLACSLQHHFTSSYVLQHFSKTVLIVLILQSNIFPPCSQIAAATTHRLIAHNSKEDTFHTAQQLLGYHLECDNDRHHYTRELVTPTEPSNRAFPRLREFHTVGNSRNLRKPYRSVAL